jgi:hypothetical protein
MELKSRLNELYAAKKRLSAGKDFQDVFSGTVAREPAPVEIKGIQHNMSLLASIPIEKLHSVFITFPGFNLSLRTPNSTHSILFRLVRPAGVLELENAEPEITNIYHITKIHEELGVALRPKAYIYWTNIIGRTCFHLSDRGGATLMPDFAKPRAAAALPQLQILVSGYKPETSFHVRVYHLRENNFTTEYQFLTAPTPLQKFTQLLDMISKQNYKLEKYKQKVAKRQRFAFTNQNNKMLNAIYGRFGGTTKPNYKP